MEQGLAGVMSRGVAVWLVLMAAETVHGILRSIFLVPLVGDLRARQFSVFVGSLLIVFLTYLFVRWIKGAAPLHFILVGAMWVFLTVGFEIVLGRFVMGLSWGRIASDYNMAEGGLMIFGLLIMMIAPLTTARLRGEV